jgi:hypothetical protein
MTHRPLRVALVSLSYCREETEIEHSYATQGLHALRAFAVQSPLVRQGCVIHVLRANFKEKALLESGLEPSPRAPRLPPPDTDVLGLTCEPWSLTYVEALIENARRGNPGIRIWLGGDYAGYLVERRKVRLGPLDLAFTGGAGYDEPAFRAALESLLDAGDVPPEVSARLDGVVRFDDQGQASAAPLASYLPLRDRPLYLDDPDLPINPVYDLFPIKVAQGCTMRCPFCTTASSSCSTDQRIDPAAPEQVERCLARARVTGCRKVVVDASYLNQDPARMRGLLQRLDDGSFDYVRAFLLLERFDQAQAELLAGLTPGRFEFEVGIQSMNPVACRAVRRRCFGIDEVRRWLGPLAAQQRVSVDYLYPLPGETRAEVCANVLALLDIPELGVRLNQLVLGPATEFGRAPGQWGLTVEDVDGYPFVVASEDFPREEVEAMHPWIADTMRRFGTRFYPTTARSWLRHCVDEQAPYAPGAASGYTQATAHAPFDQPVEERVIAALEGLCQSRPGYGYMVFDDRIELSATAGGEGRVVLHPCGESTRCYLRSGEVGLSYNAVNLTAELDAVMKELLARLEAQRSARGQ